MKKFPDKIYLTDAFEGDDRYWVDARESGEDVEYIRIDLAFPWISKSDIEKLKKLIKALEE